MSKRKFKKNITSNRFERFQVGMTELSDIKLQSLPHFLYKGEVVCFSIQYLGEIEGLENITGRYKQKHVREWD